MTVLSEMPRLRHEVDRKSQPVPVTRVEWKCRKSTGRHCQTCPTGPASPRSDRNMFSHAFWQLSLQMIQHPRVTVGWCLDPLENLVHLHRHHSLCRPCWKIRPIRGLIRGLGAIGTKNHVHVLLQAVWVCRVPVGRQCQEPQHW